MSKILQIVDKNGTAIDRMATGIQVNLPHHQIRKIAVHPKKPSFIDLELYKRWASWADLFDYHYWKTAEMLRKEYPEFNNKPSILTHYNPYNLEESDWAGYNKLIVVNQTMKKALPIADL